MRTVKYTNRFKRDYRREQSGQLGKKLDALLMDVVNLLAADAALPQRNFDHPLTGIGSIIGIATSGRIWSSSTASRTMKALNWSASVLTANLVYDPAGG
jgi:type II toxin-antitoxin system toxin YafQ